MVFTARVIEDAEEKQAVLLKNYLDYVHNKFNKYAFCFFFCELLNICISISQVEQLEGGQTKWDKSLEYSDLTFGRKETGGTF